MATAKVTYVRENGESLVCEIRVAESFPDAVSEAKAQAAGLLRDALGLVEQKRLDASG